MYSPDTDVSNVGIGIYNEIGKEVIVQVNVATKETRYVYISNIVRGLQRDLDLATLNPERLNRVFQMLYIVTGSDYVSYF